LVVQTGYLVADCDPTVTLVGSEEILEVSKTTATKCAVPVDVMEKELLGSAAVDKLTKVIAFVGLKFLSPI